MALHSQLWLILESTNMQPGVKHSNVQEIVNWGITFDLSKHILWIKIELMHDVGNNGIETTVKIFHGSKDKKELRNLTSCILQDFVNEENRFRRGRNRPS